MAEQILSKIEELRKLEQEIEPKIKELEEKRDNEIGEINKKYDRKISDVSNEVETFKKDLMDTIYQSFEQAVMNEFDSKRSTSEYSVTSQIKEYRDSMNEVDLFPDQLIEKLDKIIVEEEPIENLAYDLEKIKTQFF
ncbi:MAG: hypothetical protein GF311_15025 [Candidatus Lokiarchaeota archaeon]|nr:hypothetical protein [Candidatus Lokiarchaeota archaeon]